MAGFVGWTVFALSVIWAICTNIALRQHYKDRDRPALPANATAMTQLIGVVVVAAVGCSPFHLWVLPVWISRLFRVAIQNCWLCGMALRLRGRRHHPVELVIRGSHDLVIGRVATATALVGVRAGQRVSRLVLGMSMISSLSGGRDQADFAGPPAGTSVVVADVNADQSNSVGKSLPRAS